MRKGKMEKVKKSKDEEVNGQGRSKGGKGVPRPHVGCHHIATFDEGDLPQTTSITSAS